MNRFAKALVLLVLSSPFAGAQIVGYEGFQYSPNSALSGLNGGTGWSGGWTTTSGMTVGTGSIIAPAPADTLTTSGHHVIMPASASLASASRTFGTDLRGLSGNGSVWIGFTISRTASASQEYGGLVIGNDVGSTGTEGRLFIGDSGLTNAGTWALERGGGGAIGVSNYLISENPTVRLTVNIQFQSGPDTVLLYVNRQAGTTPGSNDAFLNTLDLDPTGGPVTNFAVWNGNDGGYQIDEIRIGLSYADVTPVPEPALILVTMGVTALGIHRFRRQN